MRFLLTLFVALSLTLAWQSSVIADVSSTHSCVAAEKAEGEKKKGAEDEEPDCD
jgi:hypothetical protein